MTFYDRVGTTLKGGTCTRIGSVPKFVDHSWLFYNSPSLSSSVFRRPGLHINCFAYWLLGVATFFAAKFSIEADSYDVYDEQGGFDGTNSTYQVSQERGHQAIFYGTNSTNQMIGFSGRLLTFVLSAYLIQIVTVYFKAVRGKARGMMYGLSKAVDILSVALDYDHSSSEACRLDLERALSAIGHYALVVVSTINIPQKAEAKEIRREVFESRKFDGDYFVSLPPKQALHVLRLAVLQAIECERAKGCLAKLTNEQHVALLSYLNDYCGGASSVSSSVSSSKLPFAYVHLVNWGVKILTAFYLVTFECLAAEDWDTTSVCMPWEICKLRESNPTASTWMFFIWVNLMTLAILYFLFGILEVYVCVNDTWQSGLVLQNYEGIIDLICEPLLMKPASIADLSAVYNTSKASIQASTARSTPK